MSASAALTLARVAIIGQVVAAVIHAVSLCLLTLPRRSAVRPCRRLLCQRLGEHWLKVNAGAVVVALMRPTTENIVIGRRTLLLTILVICPGVLPPSAGLILTEVFLAILLTCSTRRVLLRRVKRNITNFEFFYVHLITPVLIALIRGLVRLLFL